MSYFAGGPGTSAIVVSHDGGQQLLESIARLKTQVWPLHEIIVVDSGSTDDSVDRLEELNRDVQVIRLGANLGPCVARNRGADAATGRFLLMVDDDVYLEEDCLRKLVAALDETEAAVAVPRLALCPQTDIIQLDGADAHIVGTMVLRNGRAHCGTTPASRVEVGGFSTSCLLIDRMVFRAAGGFDEAFFFHFEDLELSIRLRALGHRIVCESAALAFHDRGAGTPGLSFRDRGVYPRRRAYLTMRNRLQILALHYRLRVLLLMFPALLLYEIASLAFSARNGVAGEWFRAWAWQMRHARDLLSRRKRMRGRRVVEEVALLVGGPPPLAAGLLDRPTPRRAVDLLSMVLEANWRLACVALGAGRGQSASATARVGHRSSERDH